MLLQNVVDMFYFKVLRYELIMACADRKSAKPDRDLFNYLLNWYIENNIIEHPPKFEPDFIFNATHYVNMFSISDRNVMKGV